MKSCPYRREYVFKQCQIKSCSNYNEITPSNCLKLDRVRPEGAKIISDAEINLYKFGGQISTRLVQMKRKSAIARVKRMLVLNSFLTHIKEKYGAAPHGVFINRLLKKLEQRYPLRIKELGWENWMWEYLLDEEEWERFISTSGSQEKFGVHSLLRLKIDAYEKVLRKFNSGSTK